MVAGVREDQGKVLLCHVRNHRIVFKLLFLCHALIRPPKGSLSSSWRAIYI